VGDRVDSPVWSSEQEKIICYLDKYGNTRETDLIKYGVLKLGLSEASMRRLVCDMVLCGRLERVVHKELKPPATYIREGPNASLELELQALSHSLGAGKISQDLETVRRILNEAESVSEKRIRKYECPH
jgi:hypothetical protein